MYFPDFEGIDLSLVRNPFNFEPNSFPDANKDEYLKIKFDSILHDLPEERSKHQFWTYISASYPRIGKLTMKTVLPFSRTHSRESEFFTLPQIRTKLRNRLEVKNMRYVLFTIVPRFDQLIDNKQLQPSHWLPNLVSSHMMQCYTLLYLCCIYVRSHGGEGGWRLR